MYILLHIIHKLEAKLNLKLKAMQYTVEILFVGRMDFEPSEGKYLAYPNNREIILLDCESWGQRMTFTHSLVCILVCT